VIFILHYDPLNGGRLINILQFKPGEEDVAAHARLQMEVEALESGLRREIVTLEAESLQELSKTHSRYFRSISEMTALAGESGSGGPDVGRHVPPQGRK